jgi:hypothetical protein
MKNSTVVAVAFGALLASGCDALSDNAHGSWKVGSKYLQVDSAKCYFYNWFKDLPCVSYRCQATDGETGVLTIFHQDADHKDDPTKTEKPTFTVKSEGSGDTRKVNMELCWPDGCITMEQLDAIPSSEKLGTCASR